MSAARSFRSSPFGAPGISTQSLGIPAAAYPGRIATNSDLIVAVDRQQTTLLLPLSAASTSMTVLDPSMIAASNLLSIDNEIVKTTGPPSGNVVPISRGFDGTAPAAHLANALVSGLIDAYHHNVLVAEVEAIETALGANMQNVSSKSPFIFSTDYEFAPQQPGGNLIVGSNVMTLSPVPRGVNASDQNHWLYISGGTGTAEPVLITGGSAVSGASSGIIIVTCANTHSGAWTIQSATAGIQEALSYLNGAPNWLFIPAGNHQTYATITVTASGTSLRGVSKQNSSNLWMNTPGMPAVVFYNSSGAGGNSIFDLQINDQSGAAVNANNIGVWVRYQARFIAERLTVTGFSVGIHAQDLQYCNFRDIDMIGAKQDGVLVDGSLTNVCVYDAINTEATSSSAQSGFHITQSGQIILANCSLLGGGYGLLVNPVGGQGVFSIDCLGCYFDHNGLSAVLMKPTGTGTTTRNRFSQCWMSSAAGGPGIEMIATGGAIQDILIDQCQISDNIYGVHIGAGVLNVKVRGSHIFNNATGNGILVESGASIITLMGNTIGNDSSFGTGSQTYGIFLGAVDHLVIVGNILIGNTTAPINAVSAESNITIAQNIGIDDVIPVIASAATITLPYNPVVSIAGTTTVTSMGAWVGRTVRLTKSDAGSLTIGGGGNIPLAHTLVSGGGLTLTYDGTSWM